MNPTTLAPQAEALPAPIADPKLQSVSVAHDGSVWGVSLDGNVLECTKNEIPWLPVEGVSASAIAVVGAIEATVGTAYAIIDGQPQARSLLPGASWLPLPAFGGLVKIWAATDSQGTNAVVWGALSARDVYVWSSSNPTEWVDLEWSADIMAPASDGSLYRLLDGAVSTFVNYGAGAEWRTVPTPEPFASLAAAAEDDLWGVGSSGTVYHYDGSGQWNAESEKGQFTAGVVDAGDDGTALVLFQGTIYEYQPSGTWSALPWSAAAPPAAMSVSNSETVWAIGTDDAIWRYTEDGGFWVPTNGLPSGVRQVSAASATNLWTCDGSGNLSLSTLSGGAWETTAAPGVTATMVAASADGDVLALDSAGVVHAYEIGGGWAVQSWGPALARIAVAAGRFRAGLSPSGDVFGWQPGETEWTPLSNPQPMNQVAALEGGAVLALDASGGIWIYLGTWVQCSQGSAQGNRLTQIAARDAADVWGILDTSSPLDLGAIGEVQAGQVQPGELGWDTESVTDETQSTHLWIVNRAATLAAQQGADGQAVCNLAGPQSTNPAFRKSLCQGLYDADFLPQYNNTEYGMPTWKSHFYDPDTQTNWLGEQKPTGLTQGSGFFEDAAAKYKAGDMAGAGYSLGLALHYFTDLTQPMHAANFTYLSSHPKFGYHSDFEKYVMQIQASVSPPQQYQPSALGTTPGPYLINAAKNSKQKYYGTMCPGSVRVSYVYYTQWYKTLAEQNINAILTDAITLTSQFMVAWMQSTEG